MSADNIKELRIMAIFTDENFTGYEFRCNASNANVGYKHVCEVYKDNTILPDCTSIVTWGNRTWESYPFATVLSSSKAKLHNLLAGIKEPEIEIDYDFLNKLANQDIITDYGELESGEVVILFDTWEQVEGEDEREYVKDKGMMKTGKFIKSPYAKLRELAEKKLLKPSVQSTIENVDYVFTDEYSRCDSCGKIFNTTYGELTYIENTCELLCDTCLNESPDMIETLIEDAKDDYRKALRPTVSQDTIEGLGYSLATDETFSFEREFWGAIYMTPEYAEKFVEKYNGFIQIYEVAQFVQPFQLWVPTENLKQAHAELKFRFNLYN